MRMTDLTVTALTGPGLVIIILIPVLLIALIVGVIFLMRSKKAPETPEEEDAMLRAKTASSGDSEVLSGDEQIAVSVDTTGDFMAGGIMADEPEDDNGFNAFEGEAKSEQVEAAPADDWDSFGNGDSSFEEESKEEKEEKGSSESFAAKATEESTASGESKSAFPGAEDSEVPYDEGEDETSVLGMPTPDAGSFEHITAQVEQTEEEEGDSLLGDDAFSSGRGTHRRSAQKEQQAIYYQDSFNSTGELSSENTGVPRAFVFRVGTEERCEINKARFSIGKSQNADYTVTGNNKISRVHAIVIYEKGSFFLADNHSSNRTFLENQELNPDRMYELTEGSRIRLANEEFVFHLM